jgi:hypothetical protein
MESQEFGHWVQNSGFRKALSLINDFTAEFYQIFKKSIPTFLKLFQKIEVQMYILTDSLRLALP